LGAPAATRIAAASSTALSLTICNKICRQAIVAGCGLLGKGGEAVSTAPAWGAWAWDDCQLAKLPTKGTAGVTESPTQRPHAHSRSHETRSVKPCTALQSTLAGLIALGVTAPGPPALGTRRVRKRTSAGNQRTADRPPDVRRTSAGRLPDVFRTSAKTRYWVVVVQVPTLPPHWDVVWVAEKHPQKSHNVKPKPPTLQPTRVA
jgi:hypothetical protein